MPEKFAFSRKGSLAKLRFVSTDCGQCGHRKGKSAEDLSIAATSAMSTGLSPAGGGCDGPAGVRGALGAWWLAAAPVRAGCRQGAWAGRRAGRQGIHACHLSAYIVPVGFWHSHHVCLANTAFLKTRITLGLMFCSKAFSSHFSVLLVVRLSLFFFCNWNKEQSRINTPDSHCAALHHCCESNTHHFTTLVQHFLGNNRQKLGISLAPFHLNSSGCTSWVNSTQSFSSSAVLGPQIIN